MSILVLSACSSGVNYTVIENHSSSIPEDVILVQSVLRGERGHLLNLHGYYVFQPGVFNVDDTYLWINGDGPLAIKSVTKQDGVIEVFLVETIAAGLPSDLLIKLPGTHSTFKVRTANSSFEKIVIEEIRSGLPGTFVGLIDANSIEVQIDADMAWPGNDKPTVFHLSDDVKAFFNTLKTNDRVLLTFERTKNGDLIIMEANEINDPAEQEEFGGLKATFNGLADNNSFEVTFESGQAVVGTVNIQMSDDVREVVDGLKTGDKVTLSLVRNQYGQWVATDITK